MCYVFVNNLLIFGRNAKYNVIEAELAAGQHMDVSAMNVLIYRLG